jgi:16S rRNA processing protein RimM
MNELSLSNCIQIGHFLKTHRYSGTLLLVFEPEWELTVLNANILITETDGLPVPWFISPDGIRITSHTSALIDLDWIEDQKSAAVLCGNPVYVEKSSIRSSLEKDDKSQWIGFKIYSETGNLVGIITGEENYSGNRVLSVKVKNEEKLIPFHPDLIAAVDIELQSITMRLPEGLTDI